MSKVKKKRKVDSSGSSELDIKFEKIIQFSGWIFLLVLAIFIGSWYIFSSMLGIINLDLNAMTFTFIIFIGTNSAISFALASKIKNNRDRKKEFFFDWILGELLFCIFAVFAVAVYVW